MPINFLRKKKKKIAGNLESCSCIIFWLAMEENVSISAALAHAWIERCNSPCAPEEEKIFLWKH